LILLACLQSMTGRTPMSIVYLSNVLHYRVGGTRHDERVLSAGAGTSKHHHARGCWYVL